LSSPSGIEFVVVVGGGRVAACICTRLCCPNFSRTPGPCSSFSEITTKSSSSGDVDVVVGGEEGEEEEIEEFGIGTEEEAEEEKKENEEEGRKSLSETST
jgi:hypothetical protein